MMNRWILRKSTTAVTHNLVFPCSVACFFIIILYMLFFQPPSYMFLKKHTFFSTWNYASVASQLIGIYRSWYFMAYLALIQWFMLFLSYFITTSCCWRSQNEYKLLWFEITKRKGLFHDLNIYFRFISKIYYFHLFSEGKCYVYFTFVKSNEWAMLTCYQRAYLVLPLVLLKSEISLKWPVETL